MPSMAYCTSRDHLDDLIQLARLVFARRAGQDPRELAELDLRVVELGESIEARIALAEAPSPLDRLRTAFQLEETEQRCLGLLLAHAVSSEVRAASGHGDGLPLELLDTLVYGVPALRDRFAVELGPGGRLLRYGLVEICDGGGPRLGRRLRIADRIVDLAHGVDDLGEDVAGFASLASAPPGDLLIPPELARAARAALRHHVEDGAGPVPVVCGPSGAGKRALIAAVAAELGARILDVSCRALPADPRALIAAQREAILHRAVLVFTGADELAEGPDVRARSLDAALRHYPGPVAITARRPLGAVLVPARGGAGDRGAAPIGARARAALGAPPRGGRRGRRRRGRALPAHRRPDRARGADRARERRGGGARRRPPRRARRARR